MCLAVYVASDTPLPLRAWNAEQPAFHVAALTEADGAIRTQFSKPHVVYVGAHEGCGCGFAFGEWEGEEPEEAAAGEASVRALGDYLAAATALGPSVELYACWEGDQALEPLHRRTMTPADFRGPAFWFEKRTFAIIAPAV